MTRTLGPHNVGGLATSLLLGLIMAACANPIPPTGGPTDQEPPRVVYVEPEDQAVLVEADRLTITFSEYVDQASFGRALSITPAFSRPVESSWRGRTVVVRFPEPLKQNTTYIVNLDTNLRDARGVALRSPIALAFATGARIDQGTIRGRVRGASRGAPQGGIDIYAYREFDPDTVANLPPAPDYRTQTDADGRFVFQHLPEGAPFYVIALADENRNRAAEPSEAFAPPPSPVMVADTVGGGATDAVWVLARTDVDPPVVQRVRQLSSRRIAVRFSEPVLLDGLAEGRWHIRGSQGDSLAAAWLYVSRQDAREMVAVSDSLPPGEYEIMIAGVADSTGNVVSPGAHAVSISPIADTVQVRFAGFSPDTLAAGISRLRPGESPAVHFSSGMRREAVERVITVTDTLGAEQSFVPVTQTGTSWQVTIPGTRPRDPIVLSVQDPHPELDSIHVRQFNPMLDDELGEISGYVAAADRVRVVVELSPPGRGDAIRVETDAQGRFLAERLPAGQYFIRSFADRDSTFAWSAGRIVPYEPPEAITWYPDSVRVRPRWETALEDTLWLRPPSATSMDALDEPARP